MRLIDADALTERKFVGVATWPETTEVTSWQRGWNDAIETIEEAQPSVDAVPVVRCKECKHSEHWYGDKARCFLWCETGIDVFENGFCSYGERKDNV